MTGEGIECGMLNLNEPPVVEDGQMRHIYLRKDNKPICRTKSWNLPFEVPSVWPITKFRESKTYCNSGFPQFQIYPEPENSHQAKEWVTFSQFLRKHKVAGIVNFEFCKFYILAPDPEFSHAVIIYEMGKTTFTFNEQEMATSGQLHNDSPISKKKYIQNPCKSRRLEHVDCSSNPRKLPSPAEMVMHPRYYAHNLGEEISDTGFSNSKVIGSLHNDDGLCTSKLHHAAVDPFPCESIENSPSSSHPTSVKKLDVLERNYVRTDPSYLRTLSQTHAGWIFGAIAELVDNSRDANASRLDISIECLYSKKAGKKIPVLSVIDDGHGMSHIEIMRMLSFGHKQPNEEEANRIGRFGIGFKTGTMKLGRDAVVLTQTISSRSVALLSQSYNENKENLEIPVVTYCKQGQYMETDLNIQSETHADYNLKAIKEFSPFNEYFIGQKLGLFGETGTGTQIYIWNLDEWGSDYSLEWDSGKTVGNTHYHARGDILIRSRRVRSRPGQISQKVPLDYSLQSYLEVIFLDPRMKIYVQGSLVKSRPLAKSLNKTAIISDHIMGKAVHLTLGRSKVEWERMNCGIFLYWHGRLIEAYKRVGGQIHNADMGRGVIGVVDVTSLMDVGNGNVWVLNNKQGFQDCEAYAKLEEWLGNKADEYWDNNFDTLNLKKGNELYKPDHEWVQCNKCRKWRILSPDFNSGSLPLEWFCYMPPFHGKCEAPEQQVGRGVITVAAKRSGYDTEQTINQQETTSKKANSSAFNFDSAKQSASITPANWEAISDDDCGEDSSQTEDDMPRPTLKRLRRGPARSCKKL
ncbi:uncharacterized protein [Typha angustifolia]|uniref:uncharacterized protein isoform X1 n=2 Tax=Typha angustifolia TaxID=59011 RepID=UPI003C2C87E5